jgi:hypothetical protein
LILSPLSKVARPVNEGDDNDSLRFDLVQPLVEIVAIDRQPNRLFENPSGDF